MKGTNVRLIIRKDYDAVSEWAANFVARRILAGRHFVLGLPTGSSPLGLYERLAALHARGVLSFRNVVTFNMDEYVGLPEDHPQSYHSFMRDRLFSGVDIPSGNTNIPNGNASDLDAECVRYEAAIAAAGGIDLFVGGVGEDGGGGSLAADRNVDGRVLGKEQTGGLVPVDGSGS